ncbi:hypothetical protein FRACYDRAFT_257474 [Fragilariopsis cylindrus CCMP1102]|uniref:Uncharacterized protein n=1 Tax=Fragilariopsis cylindrus CCMP1102 TaxID=635003 RepID=A0A1E7EJ30_9STRA|nr:hypothetical protein FRACYDRAFT_257474 [Fragilariopsis cylindrus CCMP1102]|eukprot:OEU05906.1 hypothetical protein FRACYDRAFT_257474 [Fragilariopsis cylindrus CCMP1102]
MTKEQFKNKYAVDVNIIIQRSTTLYGKYFDELKQDPKLFVREAKGVGKMIRMEDDDDGNDGDRDGGGVGDVGEGGGGGGGDDDDDDDNNPNNNNNNNFFPCTALIVYSKKNIFGYGNDGDNDRTEQLEIVEIPGTFVYIPNFFPDFFHDKDNDGDRDLGGVGDVGEGGVLVSIYVILVDATQSTLTSNGSTFDATTTTTTTTTTSTTKYDMINNQEIGQDILDAVEFTNSFFEPQRRGSRNDRRTPGHGLFSDPG